MTAKRKCGWTEQYLSRSTIRLTWRNHLPPARHSSFAKTTAALGDPLKWELIYQLNSGSVKNPNLIYEGQTLDIPKA
ncbi:hypothetical protein CLOBOL_04999 [Enterocloster bolteae ATCC BAA-613]|jgi:hypothetical protein|uniref:LysM domain-containing protein n=1 Tax=Enterocloster bolteae (strain ATCC BAA-613 / DSM 15670 / CCUG 46953 / JCM 12243 / WAL 16351) TaxID=411902 RepID=A8RY07_ENTBW|nr:hypothetical protein CLOBOL_04999 [Enterocloster bolteae ATCC BAA-613]